jgi:hypothetical protein
MYIIIIALVLQKTYLKLNAHEGKITRKIHQNELLLILKQWKELENHMFRVEFKVDYMLELSNLEVKEC